MSDYNNLFLSDETERMFKEALEKQKAEKREAEKKLQQEENSNQNRLADEEIKAANDLNEKAEVESSQNQESEITRENPDEPSEKESALSEITDNDSETQEIQQDRQKNPGSKKIQIACITASLLAIGYAAGGIYFTTRFFPHTKIENYNAGRKTVEQVSNDIQESLDKYSLLLKERNDAEESIKADDIDLTFTGVDDVAKILKKQNEWLWPIKVFKEQECKLDIQRTYSEESLTNVIDSLNCITDENVEAPENALLKKGDDGLYAIVPEKEGNTVNKEKLTEEITASINGLSKEINLEEKDCYLAPEIRKDDESLKQKMDFLNKYLQTNIDVHFGENVENITGKDIEKYINADGDVVSVDTDWLADIVAEWADKYNTYGKSFMFKSHSGNEVEIEKGGDYGWLMDQEKTSQNLEKKVANGESGKFKPKWLSKGAGWENNGIGNTYVEISIKEQKLWCYKDGEEILETDIVSGRNTPGRETVKGCFSIDAKETPAENLTIIDTQGKSENVKFWIQFNGGQGIHDSPWRETYGGTEYESNGTHGKINLPQESMQALYEAVEPGIPIIIY